MRTNTHPHDYHRPIFAVGDYLAKINAARDRRDSLERELENLNPRRFYQVAATQYRLSQDEYDAALEAAIAEIKNGP